MNRPNIPTKQSANNDDEKKKQKMRQWQTRFGLSYIIASLIGIWLFQQFILNPLVVREAEIPYSEFKAKLKTGRIANVTIGQDRIIGTLKAPPDTSNTNQPVAFATVAVPNGDPTLIQELDAAGVQYSISPPPSPLGGFLLAYGLPLILIGGYPHYP